MFTMAQPYTRLNMIPDVNTENLGVFGEYEWHMADRLVLRGGLRGDLTHIEADQQNNATLLDDSTDFTEASGNLQLTWTAAEGLEVFVGAGRGVRPPDAQELYLDVPAMPPAVTWRGNPDLEASVNHQADLGLKYATGRLYLTGSLFYSRVDDFINFYAPSAVLKSYRNIDASFWGGEVGAQASLAYDLFLKASLSYVEGRNEEENRPLAEIPPLEGSVALRYDVDRWFFEVSENFAARQDRVDSSLSEEETPGWMTTDLRAGLKYGVVSLYAGVENLLDKQYFSHLSYLRDPFASGEKVPENGRTFYATVVCSF
jgi:iron complex outermembrane receptor protein